MKNIIETKNIYKSFGAKESKTQVLTDISLKISQGEFISLMGASGSGKSTLLYLLSGLDYADSGSILIDECDISSLTDRKRSVLRREKASMIFQFFNLVQNLNVEDNIFLPVSMGGGKYRYYKEKINEILDITGLSEKRKSYPCQLSGGQQQRVAIARAIISEPEIILADEPTGNLDSVSGAEIMKLFKKINQENHITILMVTHSAECAMFSDRIITLADGKII